MCCVTVLRNVFRLIWTGALVLTGCSRVPAKPVTPAPRVTLTVFAAASLSDAFTEIGQAFEAAQPGVKVVFNFAGSQQLRTQLEQGAQADVFVSADVREMDAAIAAGLVVSGTQVVFVHNQLTVILPKDNPGHVEHLADLARPGLKLVLAAENVPVGAYTRQALDRMAADPAFPAGFKAAVLANLVSSEDNVKQVVAKVSLGDADAGIVYISDVTPAVAVRVTTLPIPDRYNITATYLIAPLHHSSQPVLAAEFVAIVLSPAGQAALRHWGFLPVRP